MFFGYARISTKGQNASGQVMLLEQAGVHTANVFIDIASGSTVDRPNLKKLLDSVKAGDCVIITALDRLSRKSSDLFDLIDRFEAKGCAVKFLNTPIDTSGPTGRVVLSVLAAVAQYEKDLIASRVKAGQKQAKASGKHIGRPPAFTPDQLLGVLQRAKNGQSLSQIAESYNCHRSTVHRALSLASSKGVTVESDVMDIEELLKNQ